MNFARASEKPSLVGVGVCRSVAEDAGDVGRRNGDDRTAPPWPSGDGLYADGTDISKIAFPMLLVEVMLKGDFARVLLRCDAGTINKMRPMKVGAIPRRLEHCTEVTPG
jgi:hypothetical protein